MARSIDAHNALATGYRPIGRRTTIAADASTKAHTATSRPLASRYTMYAISTSNGRMVNE